MSHLRHDTTASEAEPSPDQPLGVGEAFVDQLLQESHLAAPHELPGLLEAQAQALGCGEALAYLADLQQDTLIPFSADGTSREPLPLSVGSTLAGWVYQRLEVRFQQLSGHAVRVWLPLLNGAERLGVLAVTVTDGRLLQAGALPHVEEHPCADQHPPAEGSVPDEAVMSAEAALLMTRLRRLASLFAEMVMTKTMYGDTLVVLRRRGEMALAAEIQWSLLPPLTFASRDVTIAASLEPAYDIAGDSVDYAANRDRVHAAVFDGMGHGLQAAQLAVLAVTAYRHARRSGRRLAETAAVIDVALNDAFGADGFATGILAELDTTSGELQWVSAGHHEPFLLREGRFVKMLSAVPMLPFGLSTVAPHVRPVVGVEPLQPGDRVVLYTDGAIEARSPEGEFFGVERLIELVLRHLASGLPAPETMRRVIRALLDHQQGQLADDATLLLLEWRSGNEQSFPF